MYTALILAVLQMIALSLRVTEQSEYERSRLHLCLHLHLCLRLHLYLRLHLCLRLRLHLRPCLRPYLHLHSRLLAYWHGEAPSSTTKKFNHVYKMDVSGIHCSPSLAVQHRLLQVAVLCTAKKNALGSWM